MLSQLNLRFQRKLIETLKARAGQEHRSLNSLVETYLNEGLKKTLPDDSYLRLISDPQAAMLCMYRKIILKQTFGADPVSRDELRYLIELSRDGYITGHNRLAALPALRILLEITQELLSWQVEHDLQIDLPALKGAFRLEGNSPVDEFSRFMTQLRPVIDQDYAERLLRPLSGGSFDLQAFPDDALASIFTLSRLQKIFPLAVRAQNWSQEDVEKMVEQLHPKIPAVQENFRAGSLQFDIRVDGQSLGQRPGAWYATPRLHLLITGLEFVVHCEWEHFSELLGLFTLYSQYPDALAQGHHGQHVMFSPPGNVTADGFFGFNGLRIFLPADEFSALVSHLTDVVGNCTLAEALTGLRCLYGDV